jgi:hypothetical protein
MALGARHVCVHTAVHVGEAGGVDKLAFYPTTRQAWFDADDALIGAGDVVGRCSGGVAQGGSERGTLSGLYKDLLIWALG